MQYSPKLKKAMEEIKTILKKYDLGAMVVIHTPGHSEFVLKVDPSYSCAKFNQTGDGINFKTKGLPKAKQKELARDTANM